MPFFPNFLSETLKIKKSKSIYVSHHMHTNSLCIREVPLCELYSYEDDCNPGVHMGIDNMNPRTHMGILLDPHFSVCIRNLVPERCLTQAQLTN